MCSTNMSSAPGSFQRFIPPLTNSSFKILNGRLSSKRWHMYTASIVDQFAYLCFSARHHRPVTSKIVTSLVVTNPICGGINYLNFFTDLKKSSSTFYKSKKYRNLLSSSPFRNINLQMMFSPFLTQSLQTLSENPIAFSELLVFKCVIVSSIMHPVFLTRCHHILFPHILRYT